LRQQSLGETETGVLPVLSVKDNLVRLLQTKQARIGVIGLGYVGMPLALEFARAGFDVMGFEVSDRKAAALNKGSSPLPDLENADDVAQLVADKRLRATTNFSELKARDCIIVCVPTPVNLTDDPDVTHLQSATDMIAANLRRGQLVVLESTTYPGTTDELILPTLRKTGLKLDADFLLAFSPERIDPGSLQFKIRDIPKVIGGCSADSTEATKVLYAPVITTLHGVSSARVAETVKLLENTFRAVNIGLVNEISQLCYDLKIDIWEVIDAAKTKPFGFMPFYPGPGIGGECIPLTPLYLSWKGRQHGFASRFITLARQINSDMPNHVVELASDALSELDKPLKGARVLIIGAAFKKNVSDVRESPSLDIIRILREKKAIVEYHDPFVPHIPVGAFKHTKRMRSDLFFDVERRTVSQVNSSEHRRLSDPLTSIELTKEALSRSDCVIIVTDHAKIDFEQIVAHAPLVIDTRNALSLTNRDAGTAKVVRL
jgi:UDP-N-acetyl-D-glucosamine dehydrogenase